MITRSSIISDKHGVENFPLIMQTSQNLIQDIPPVLWIMNVFSISTVIRGEHLKTDYLELTEY